MHRFLCSLYAPPCTIMDRAIPPCKSLCHSARLCESIMRTFDFPWPENLDCTKFPEDGPGVLCVSNNSTDNSTARSHNFYSTPSSTLSKNKPFRNSNNGHVDYKTNPSHSHRDIGFVCPVQLKAPQVMGYQLNVGGKVSLIVQFLLLTKIY